MITVLICILYLDCIVLLFRRWLALVSCIAIAIIIAKRRNIFKFVFIAKLFTFTMINDNFTRQITYDLIESKYNFVVSFIS